MLQEVTEGKVVVTVGSGKVSKKLEVFYNPVMKFNRDMSVLLLNSIDKKNMQIALPLAGSGVRGVRFFKELDKGKIKTVFFNDYSNSAVKSIKKNLRVNKIKSKFKVSCKDANLFLLEGLGFDHIDIDPFGSPNPFLDSAIKRLARDSILSVTATDTAALCGTVPKACERKYWAKPLHSSEMHEVGLRILIRKIQLVGAQFEKSLVPIFSYSKDHYMRVFFLCKKGKKLVDLVLKSHGFYKCAGPLWLGNLYDSELVKKMVKNNCLDENNKFLSILSNELALVGFFDIHEFCKRNKLVIPKTDLLLTNVKDKGFLVSKTHFCDTGFKSNITEESLIEIIRNITHS